MGQKKYPKVFVPCRFRPLYQADEISLFSEYCWTEKKNSYLYGYAKNAQGRDHTTSYNNLVAATKACIELGNGCAGVTVSNSGAATLRKGTEFKTSPSGETSYKKSACTTITG